MYLTRRDFLKSMLAVCAISVLPKIDGKLIDAPIPDSPLAIMSIDSVLLPVSSLEMNMEYAYPRMFSSGHTIEPNFLHTRMEFVTTDISRLYAMARQANIFPFSLMIPGSNLEISGNANIDDMYHFLDDNGFQSTVKMTTLGAMTFSLNSQPPFPNISPHAKRAGDA